MPTNVFHWSFYTKDNPELQRALCELRADRSIKISPLLVDIVEKGLRSARPKLFEAKSTTAPKATAAPATNTTRTRK